MLDFDKLDIDPQENYNRVVAHLLKNDVEPDEVAQELENVRIGGPDGGTPGFIWQEDIAQFLGVTWPAPYFDVMELSRLAWAALDAAAWYAVEGGAK